MAQKMALWGADAELTSVPVWYARPCFFDGKVVEGCLDFRGEHVVYADGDAVAYFSNKAMGGLHNGTVYYLKHKEGAESGVFEVLDARGGKVVKVTAKKGEQGDHLFVKVEQEAEVEGKPQHVMMPVDIELAKCKINGMVSPGWYRLMTFTTEGGVKRVKAELVVSLRSMKLAEGKEVAFDSANLMGADAVIKQDGVDVTIKGGALPQPATVPTVTLQARSADIEGITTDSRGLTVKADLNVRVADSVFDGVTVGTMVPKTETSDAIEHGKRALTVECGGVVEVKGSEFKGKAYNSIAIGQTVAPRKVTIEGVDFSGVITNNAISLFQWVDGAEMVIRNCHFAKVSNILRLGLATGGKLTVKFIDCVVDEWDSAPDYAAAVCCQDPTDNFEEAVARNIFADVKIEFVNFVYAGKKIMELRPEGHTQDVVFVVHGSKSFKIRREPELQPTVTFA